MTTTRGPVGLVGAGLLGTAIAERLLAAGFEVFAFDVDAERRAEVERIGASVVADVSDLASRCRRIVLCLPNSDIVASIVAELRPFAASIDLVVDTTTGDPEATAVLATDLATEGIGWIDACVLGSSEHLRQGEAMLLLGGEPADVDGAVDILDVLGTDRRHLGPAGSGERMKLVANLVLGLNRAALAEGLHLAESLGLAPSAALEVLASGLTYSRVMDVKGPRMVARDYAPAARLAQHLKDVRLVLETASRAGTSLPLSAVHRDLLERAEQLGFGDADNAAVYEAWRRSE